MRLLSGNTVLSENPSPTCLQYCRESTDGVAECVELLMVLRTTRKKASSLYPALDQCSVTRSRLSSDTVQPKCRLTHGASTSPYIRPVSQLYFFISNVHSNLPPRGGCHCVVSGWQQQHCGLRRRQRPVHPCQHGTYDIAVPTPLDCVVFLIA